MNRAKHIRFVLKMLHWSQQTAADKLDLNIRTIRRYCAGEGCPKYVLMALMYYVFDAGLLP